MNDIIRHIKEQISEVTKSALQNMEIAIPDADAFKAATDSQIEIEIPKDKAHGCYEF